MAEKKYDILKTGYGDFETTFNRMYLQRKRWIPDNPKHVLSSIPGTVEQIVVKEGQEVKEGDPLIVYKAMKMDNQILAPMTGKVKKIHVKQGGNVKSRTLLIEFA